MKTNTITYRWLYIAFASIITSIVLHYYAKALPELISDNNIKKEVFMCSGQIVWQGIILFVFVQQKIVHYLYQMITVSLLGSFALIPIILWHSHAPLSLSTRILLFFIVVLCMIIDHYRRVKKLELPSYLTVTWIVYRILWLPILLF